MDLTGRKLGKYTLTERLGQGGMAQVYKAIQPTIERPVAVKILHSHLAESDDFVSRFKREARGLGQLQHPHIVQVIDFDAADGVYYMVVDYIPGPTLRAYLDDQGALPPVEALRVATQLADALTYAHARGTIHRDIKPANVLFKDMQYNHAVLTDFGIGRLVDDATMTMSGAIIGTPAYMSPEAVMGQRVDGRADIYSLGIILYEMVSGHVPYTGNTPMSVIMKQVNEPLPSLRKLKPNLPNAVVQLTEHALQKDPQDRFQTAEEFLTAMQATSLALEEGRDLAPFATVVVPEDGAIDETLAGTAQAVEATPPPPPTFSPAEPVASAHQRPRGPLFAVLGIVVAALVIIGGWTALREGGSNTAGAPTATTEPVVAVVASDAPEPTVEPEPSAAPTDVPAVASTAAPTALPTTESLPSTVAGSLGMLRFADTETVRGGNFTLHLDRVVQPAAGMHYELWLQGQDGTARNLGTLPVTNGHVFFKGSLEENLVSATSNVLITLEPDGTDNSQATTPSGPVAFAGALPETYTTEMRQVLVDGANDVGLLIGAEEQGLVAVQHGQFSQEALDENDLAEAQRHAEHVINILDGEDGEFFGDVNLDGQPQNPGDGFGVRAYLQESRTHIQNAFNSVEPTVDRQYHVDRALAASDNSLNALDEAIQNALSVQATDTVDEARPFVEALNEQLRTLVNGTADQEGLTALYDHALALVAIPVLSEQNDLPAPDAVFGTVPGRVGKLRLSNSDDSQANEFLLQIGQIAPPPVGMHYDAWVVDDGEEVLFLGELDITNHHAILTGSQEANLLATDNRLIISLEDTAPNMLPSEVVLYEADLISGGGQDIQRLFAANDEESKGLVFGANEQTDLALQHREFAQEALTEGDLAEAQRHTEHVINILDGEDGTHFGDLNLDGQPQNPGDGVGVRGYLQQLTAAMEALQTESNFTGNQRFYADRVLAISANAQSTTEMVIQQSLKVLASDTPEEAQVFLDEAERLLGELVGGVDVDENGTIDPLLSEGGLGGINDMTLALHEISIFPVEVTGVTPATLQ